MSESTLCVQELDIRLTSHNAAIDVVKSMGFTLKKGETLCLVGESGSGKSVTALSLMRLLDQAEYGQDSQILLDDRDLLTLPEVSLRKIRGATIAIIFQEPMTSLNPVLTVGSQIDEASVIHLGTSKKDAKIRTLQLLNDVGIGDPNYIYDQYPHQLSGGMRQRVVIAMALAGEPDVLIADEPTTALDVTIQAQVLTLLKDLGKSRHMGVLFITHDLAIVSSIADKVAVMHQGVIVEQSSRDDFFKGPKDPYSLKLFNAAKELTLPVATHDFSHDRTVLSVHNLCVHYPIKHGLFKRTVGFVKAVDHISFKLKKGQTLAIVGESGSGKTSTALALMRLIDDASGHVIFQGQDILQLSSRVLRPLRRYLQMIFQDPMGSLNPRLTVRDILSEGWDAQGLYLSPLKREVELQAALRSVDLPENSLDRYPHEFSGGQRQRIAIARAIAMHPQIIVCDEPTSALDVSVQSQIIALLRQLQKDRQLSYIFISHNIPVVSYIAHQVAVMYLGKIVEYGTVHDIIREPKHPYTQALLAAVPLMTEEAHPIQSLSGEIPSPANPPSGCHFHPRCPFAMPKCSMNYPSVTELSKSHQVRCYLYEKDQAE